MRILCQNKPFRFIYDVDRFCYSPTEYYRKTLSAQPALALSPVMLASQSLNCLLGAVLRAQNLLISTPNEDKTQK